MGENTINHLQRSILQCDLMVIGIRALMRIGNVDISLLLDELLREVRKNECCTICMDRTRIETAYRT